MKNFHKLPIKYIDRDIGFTTTNSKGKQVIYLNKNLKKWPVLYNKVLMHEKEHLKSTRPMDFAHDIKDSLSFGLDRELLEFIIKNPRALSSISPIWFMKVKPKNKNKPSYTTMLVNWFLLLFYSMILIILLAIIIVLTR